MQAIGEEGKVLICKELIEYLSRFKPEEAVAVIVADPKKRLHHKLCGYYLIHEYHALLLETNETEPLDEVAEMEEPSKCQTK